MLLLEICSAFVQNPTSKSIYYSFTSPNITELHFCLDHASIADRYFTCKFMVASDLFSFLSPAISHTCIHEEFGSKML
jgi:hypothetical protein